MSSPHKRGRRPTPRYMKQTRNAANVHCTVSHTKCQSPDFPNSQARTFRSPHSDPHAEFDREDEVKEEERFRLMQAKRVRAMIQTQYLTQLKKEQRAKADAQRTEHISALRKANAQRKQERADKLKQLEQDKADLIDAELEEEKREKMRLMAERMKAVEAKKREERRALAEKVERENERRKQQKLERTRQFAEREREKQRQLALELEKAEQRRQAIAERKEQQHVQQRAKMRLLDEERKVKLLKMKHKHDAELRRHRSRSLAQFETVERRQKQLDLERKLSVERRKVCGREKRRAVRKRKYSLMQSQSAKARESLAEKSRAIQDRMQHKDEATKVKSRSIREEMQQRRERVLQQSECAQQAESEYVHCLQDRLREKDAKMREFQRNKQLQHRLAMEKRVQSKLRKQKFSNIVSDVLRNGNAMDRLQRLGLNMDDPDNIDLKELADLLASPGAVKSPGTKGKRTKCMIRSQSNLYKPRAQPRPFASPMRSESEYRMTDSRKILFSMAM